MLREMENKEKNQPKLHQYIHKNATESKAIAGIYSLPSQLPSYLCE